MTDSMAAMAVVCAPEAEGMGHQRASVHLRTDTSQSLATDWTVAAKCECISCCVADQLHSVCASINQCDCVQPTSPQKLCWIDVSI